MNTIQKKKYPVIKKVVTYEQVNQMIINRTILVYVFGVLVYFYVSNKV